MCSYEQTYDVMKCAVKRDRFETIEGWVPMIQRPTDHGGVDGATKIETLTENQLIAELGRLYYLEDVPKVELARRFGISRFKIARMLTKGRERGVIRIEIHEPTMNLVAYSEPLRATLGLPLVRVIESRGEPGHVRDEIGAMGAQVLREIVRPGDVVGMGWGRTVLSVASHLGEPPELTIVQLSGIVPSSTPSSPIERVRSRVEGAGGAVHSISAPLFAGSEERRDKWSADLGYVRHLYEHLDLAIVPIGSWDPPETELRRVFPPAIREQLDEVMPVAEMLGYWFNADGGVVAPEITRMCVTAETQHLSAAPHVVAVASGISKARAILGVARSGLITGLVTDRETAEHLLLLASE